MTQVHGQVYVCTAGLSPLPVSLFVDASKINQGLDVKPDECQVDDFKWEPIESSKPVGGGTGFGLVFQNMSIVNIVQCVVLDVEKNICRFGAIIL